VNTGVGQNVHLGLWSLGVTNHFNGMLDTTLIYGEALTHEK
jgi:hypothetical protein